MLVVTASCAFLAGASGPTAATLEISHGKITAIHHELRSSASYGAEVDFIDTGEAWLLPGLVDAHVHLNEPGRTEWEGFATGSSAGAAGGVTTIVDMPLNAIPPTTNVHNLSEKVDAAAGQCRVDVGFWGGVIPGNEDDLIPLVKAGVKGFKCFLIESGVDEFPCVNEAEVMTAMAKLDVRNLPSQCSIVDELSRRRNRCSSSTQSSTRSSLHPQQSVLTPPPTRRSSPLVPSL